MKTKASQTAHRGSDFRDFLASEDILPEVEVLALKRVVSLQLQQILEQEHVTKIELASRMKISRASLDRMLDPSKQKKSLPQRREGRGGAQSFLGSATPLKDPDPANHRLDTSII